MRSNQREFTTTELSQQVKDALHAQYSRRDGHRSLDKLSQGEVDILNLAREALGWPSITSLAHKYYPLYPDRKWWKRALERCARQKVRTVTLNIVYLLHALATIKAMAVKAAFSGNGVLNRLVQSTNNKSNRDSNRLVPQQGIVNNGGRNLGLNPLTQRLNSLLTSA